MCLQLIDPRAWRQRTCDNIINELMRVAEDQGTISTDLRHTFLMASCIGQLTNEQMIAIVQSGIIQMSGFGTPDDPYNLDPVWPATTRAAIY
jgi:hypothetical protein